MAVMRSGVNDAARGGVYVVEEVGPEGFPVRFFTAGYAPDGKLVQKQHHLDEETMRRACAAWESRGLTRADKAPGPPTPEERADAFLAWCAERTRATFPEGARAELARLFREARDE